MPSPITRVGVGAFIAGAAGVTVAVPSGVAAGDLLLLAVECGGSDVVPTPSGWSLIGSSSCKISGAFTSRLHVFRKTAGASEANLALVDAGNHQCAVMLAYRGCQATPLYVQTSDYTDYNWSQPRPRTSAQFTTGGGNQPYFVGFVGLDADTNSSAAVQELIWDGIIGHPPGAYAEHGAGMSPSVLVQSTSNSGTGGGLIVVDTPINTQDTTGMAAITIQLAAGLPSVYHSDLGFILEAIPVTLTFLYTGSGGGLAAGSGDTAYVTKNTYTGGGEGKFAGGADITGSNPAYQTAPTWSAWFEATGADASYTIKPALLSQSIGTMMGEVQLLAAQLMTNGTSYLVRYDPRTKAAAWAKETTGISYQSAYIASDIGRPGGRTNQDFLVYGWNGSAGKQIQAFNSETGALLGTVRGSAVATNPAMSGIIGGADRDPSGNYYIACHSGTGGSYQSSVQKFSSTLTWVAGITTGTTALNSARTRIRIASNTVGIFSVLNLAGTGTDIVRFNPATMGLLDSIGLTGTGATFDLSTTSVAMTPDGSKYLMSGDIGSGNRAIVCVDVSTLNIDWARKTTIINSFGRITCDNTNFYVSGVCTTGLTAAAVLVYKGLISTGAMSDQFFVRATRSGQAGVQDWAGQIVLDSGDGTGATFVAIDTGYTRTSDSKQIRFTSRIKVAPTRIAAGTYTLSPGVDLVVLNAGQDYINTAHSLTVTQDTVGVLTSSTFVTSTGSDTAWNTATDPATYYSDDVAILRDPIIFTYSLGGGGGRPAGLATRCLARRFAYSPEAVARSYQAMR